MFMFCLNKYLKPCSNCFDFINVLFVFLLAACLKTTTYPLPGCCLEQQPPGGGFDFQSQIGGGRVLLKNNPLGGDLTSKVK